MYSFFSLRTSACPLIFKRKIDVDHLELRDRGRLFEDPTSLKFELVPFLVKKGREGGSGRDGAGRKHLSVVSYEVSRGFHREGTEGTKDRRRIRHVQSMHSKYSRMDARARARRGAREDPKIESSI